MFGIGDNGSERAPPHYKNTSVENLTPRKFDGNDNDSPIARYSPLIGDFDGDSRADFVNVYVSKLCQTVEVNGGFHWCFSSLTMQSWEAPAPNTTRSMSDLVSGPCQ